MPEPDAAYYAMIKLIDDQIGRVICRIGRHGTTRQYTGHFHERSRRDARATTGWFKRAVGFTKAWCACPDFFMAGACEVLAKGATRWSNCAILRRSYWKLAGLEVPRPGCKPRSLLPVLRARKPPDEHRDFVRCEYYNALDQADGTYATMYRNRQYKLVVYHGHGLGELYDLAAGPGRV